MGRIDLERLSKDELIELVLKLQRPEKTSRTSSKPPSTDRKARRDQLRPGSAKPGHQGHIHVLAEKPDAVIEYRPACCPDCGLVLSPALAAETVSVRDGQRSRADRVAAGDASHRGAPSPVRALPSRRGPCRPTTGGGGSLRRDKRADRGVEQLLLGIPVRRGSRAPRPRHGPPVSSTRSWAGIGRPCGCPTTTPPSRSRREAADLPGASRARCCLCARDR